MAVSVSTLARRNAAGEPGGVERGRQARGSPRRRKGEGQKKNAEDRLGMMDISIGVFVADKEPDPHSKHKQAGPGKQPDQGPRWPL